MVEMLLLHICLPMLLLYQYYNLEINSCGSPSSPHVFCLNPPGAQTYTGLITRQHVQGYILIPTTLYKLTQRSVVSSEFTAHGTLISSSTVPHHGVFVNPFSAAERQSVCAQFWQRTAWLSQNYLSEVEFMYLVFIRMQVRVIVGDSGLCCCYLFGALINSLVFCF